MNLDAIARRTARERGYEWIEVDPLKQREKWLALRGKDVTASVSGALLGDGVHEYTTRYGLWALKTGRLQEDAEETAPMRRGRLLEPVAVEMLREERPTWKIDRASTYFRDPVARIGATPDAFAIDPERAGFGVVQVKTAGESLFAKKWLDQDTRDVIPPLWIAVQAIIEAQLTGASWACVAPLRCGWGIDIDIVDIPLHVGVWKQLLEATNEFWELIASGATPSPDYARDGATIAALFGDDSAGEVDLGADKRMVEILARRAELKAAEAAGDAAAKQRKALDAEIIVKLGNHSSGRLADGRVVTAKTVNRDSYTVASSSYRTVRVKGDAPATAAPAIQPGGPF